MEKVIIAVDAGGTKTKVCALNRNLDIIYEITGGPGSPAVLKNEAFNTIFNLVKEVYEHVKSNYNVTYVQMGISGLGTVSNVHDYELELQKVINVEVSMENDAILGLYSIVEDKADQGILVLSGTGSSCLGINGKETMLIGGFGHLLTETGSSYASVRMLVCNIINQYEETKTYTELGNKFMASIGAKTIYDFKIFMYQQNKNQIAEHAKFIAEQAILGNNEAIEILKKCGRDLAHSVSLLYKHLALTNKAVIGFRGSFVQKAPYVKEQLLQSLNNNGFYPFEVEGSEDPIYGAYYMALKKGKIC